MQCFVCMFHNKEKDIKLLYSELRERERYMTEI